MHPHLLANYIVRPSTKDDVQSIIDLVYAFETVEAGEADRYTVDDILAEWERLNPKTDTWCIFSPEEELVAYGSIFSHNAADYGRLTGDGYVHPAHYERGLGSMLLNLIESRAVEIIATVPEGSRQVLVNYILANSFSARTLLETHGYSLRRIYFSMDITFDKEPEHQIIWPETINVRACDGSLEDIHRAYETIEEGFRDHFEHAPVSFEAWQQSMVRENFDPSLWFLAVDGTKVAGAILCQVADSENRIGRIPLIAVLSPWRKRGLGSALLHHAFDAFYQRGIKRVTLAVDGQSLTGAQRLYESVGMRVMTRIGRYEKELRSGRELYQGL